VTGRAGGAQGQAFAIARAPYHFRFPRDHAAHPQYRSEWWYYTGHLAARDGRRFGYEATFFRIALRPGDPEPALGQSRWRGNQLFAAHLALTDESSGRFLYAERIAREALGMGAAAADRLRVHVDDWNLSGETLWPANRERMTVRASAGTFGLELEQLPEKAPAIHGQGGVSRKGACASCASHYYSYTRLATTGTLAYGGERLPVAGLSWMDHEFGSDELEPDQVGWDWFSLQGDGREIMLYRLRRRDGGTTPQSSGSLIERNGRVRPLALGDFFIDATGRWVSPHSGGTYPSGWRVRVPLANLDLVVTPAVLDQELVFPAQKLAYWEGAVDIRGSAGTRAVAGEGYVELTGYAGAMTL
jgi:predicted secreted hydrolase